MKTMLLWLLLTALPVFAGQNISWTLDIPDRQLWADVDRVVKVAVKCYEAQGLKFPDGATFNVGPGKNGQEAQPVCLFVEKGRWILIIPCLQTRYYDRITYQLCHEMGHAWLKANGLPQDGPGAEAFCSWMSARGIEFLEAEWRENPPEPKAAFMEYAEKCLSAYLDKCIWCLEQELNIKRGEHKKKLVDMGHDEACLFGIASKVRRPDEALKAFGFKTTKYFQKKP